MNDALSRAGICVCMVLVLFAMPAMAEQTANAALDETIKDYCAAWSETDTLKRQKLLEKVWAAGGTYTDPGAAVKGRAGLAAHIGAVQKGGLPPGTRLVVTTPVELHHGLFRFSWKAVAPGDIVVIQGMDFGEVATDGRIRKIVGFFDPLPSQAK